MSHPALSFELFPPKNARQQHNLWRCIGQLEHYNPQFISLTRGALGSQTDGDETLMALQKEVSGPIAAHITAQGTRPEQLKVLLKSWHDQGIRHLVTLRGDAPAQAGDLEDALALIELAQSVGDFSYRVAGYPETHPMAKDEQHDLSVLKAKCDLGAKEVLTQFFFDPELFLKFRDRCVKFGIDTPIAPGILPIADFGKVTRFAKQCGTALPASYHQAFEGLEGNIAVSRQLGLDLSMTLCERLKEEGVDRFHLYTLNIANFTSKLAEHLG